MTRWQRLRYEVLPPARRPVTARALAPYLAFLLLFGGGCLAAELLDHVVFTRPLAFLLLLVTPWLWWCHHVGYSGLRGGRATVALWMRLLLAGVFVLALAEPRAVRTSDRLSVVYVLDLSDSIGGEAGEEALKFIARTVGGPDGKPAKDEAGLVVFGANASVELPPRTSFLFDNDQIVISSRVRRDGTDLSQGLGLAAALVPEEERGRLVLISDGTATEGSLVSALEDLRARDLQVDVLPIQYDYEHEVWLEKLDLPKRVRLGETYEARVVLSALSAGAGTLRLRENGQTVYETEVEYRAGKNSFALPLYMRQPGYYEYAATIEVPTRRDGWPQNNIAMNSLFLKGEGKVLIVTDPEGRPEDWRALAQGLRQAKRAVEVANAYDFPRDPLSLMPYDCILFVNAPAHAFDAVQLEAVRDAVRHQGVGFVMVGGKNSFGAGGYHRTAVEEALPVSMDVSQKKVLPKGALVIVLHTCEFAEGNTWGQRIAKEAIRVLMPQDEVGVLVYDWQGGESWLFPLTPAREYKRLFRLIEGASIGDMPSFVNTMQMGLTALQQSDAGTKHMIIISDGDPSPPAPTLLAQFRASRISVSTVAINPHGGVEMKIMDTIARATRGRYYYPKNPKRLPSIFIKEAKTLMERNLIQNESFAPQVEMPSQVLKGIQALPPLHGMVLTTAKPQSLTILRAPKEEDLDPVLSTWRYGLGKTAAFTSDLSTNWGRDWVAWEQYRAFLRQLMTDVSRVDRPVHIQVDAYAAGQAGVITVEDQHSRAGLLQVRARIIGPEDRSEAVRLRQVAPRRYQGQVPLWGKGRYQVLVRAEGDGREEQVSSGLVVPYSPEYLRFRADPLVLKDVARATGGRILAGDEKGDTIFRKERPPRATSRPILDLVLLLLACLIPLDVAVRRVQIDWAVVRGWLRLRRKAEAAQTMSALLRRKRQMAEEREAPAEALPPEPGRRAGAGTERSGPRPPRTPRPEAPAPETEREEDAPSTTGRLLAKKRKWKRDDEES